AGRGGAPRAPRRGPLGPLPAAQAPLRRFLDPDPPPHRRPDPGWARHLSSSPRAARSDPAPTGGAPHRALGVGARPCRGRPALAAGAWHRAPGAPRAGDGSGHRAIRRGFASAGEPAAEAPAWPAALRSERVTRRGRIAFAPAFG